jgi:hypothetical protein
MDRVSPQTNAEVIAALKAVNLCAPGEYWLRAVRASNYHQAWLLAPDPTWLLWGLAVGGLTDGKKHAEIATRMLRTLPLGQRPEAPLLWDALPQASRDVVEDIEARHGLNRAPDHAAEPAAVEPVAGPRLNPVPRRAVKVLEVAVGYAERGYLDKAMGATLQAVSLLTRGNLRAVYDAAQAQCRLIRKVYGEPFRDA